MTISTVIGINTTIILFRNDSEVQDMVPYGTAFAPHTPRCRRKENIVD